LVPISAKKDHLEGPLRSKGTSPKGQYIRKELLDDDYRPIMFKNDGPEGPLRSKVTVKGHYVRKAGANLQLPLHNLAEIIGFCETE
jgi:hypothetical protein